MTRISPDDELFRTNTVWLGPKGLTLPWTARYLAYGIWLIVFLLILLVEGITPLHVGVPPAWEICITTLATYVLLGFVDHERSVASVMQTFIADLRAPRDQKAKAVELQVRLTVARRVTSKINVYRRGKR